MKEYKNLMLSSVLESEFNVGKAVCYSEASKVLGVCSLTAIWLKNAEGEVVEKERVWMAASGSAWVRTAGFDPVGTVKGVYEGKPVVRHGKYGSISPMTIDEAHRAIGACSLAEAYLCDGDDNLVRENGAPVLVKIWLSLSGTYWAKLGGHVDENIGFTL